MKCQYMCKNHVDGGIEVPEGFVFGLHEIVRSAWRNHVWNPIPLVWGRGQIPKKMSFARN